MMNLNEIAASLYDTVKSINSAITETVGLDVMWFRALPDANSADVIISEYTLTHVEAGKKLKIVTNKSDYNPGNYKIDLFGVSYEAPLDISIDIEAWKNVYGNDSMPQKGDIVYVAIINKLFEVKTSTIQYGVAELPTAYTVSLSKYNPSASRKENIDLEQSIAELTVSQEDLFGDQISAEVTDIVQPHTFGEVDSTFVDPRKSFDMNSIITERAEVDGVTIGEAHYSFKNAALPVTYNVSMTYPVENRSLMLSFWFRIAEKDVESKKRVSSRMSKTTSMSFIEMYDKGRAETVFCILSKQKTLKSGEEIIMSRGEKLQIRGRVKSFDKEEKRAFVIIKNSDVLDANTKIRNWWRTSGWQLSLKNESDDMKIFTMPGIIDAALVGRDLKIDILGKHFTKEIPSTMKTSKWNFACLNISTEGEVYIIFGETYSYRNNTKLRPLQKILLGKLKLPNDVIESENLVAGCHGSLIELMGIHLITPYGNVTEDQIKIDALSKYVSNESDSIVVDMPNINNKMNYIGRMS